MYIGKTPTVGNFQVCDAISVVNGQAAYTLQVGGVNVAPESANHMLVSLNGILQKPGSSFTISGSTMTFASNLATGDVIDFVQILGNVLDIGQPSDDTVTAAKLATTSITGQTAETSAADADTILIHDNSASALRKMTRSNFLSGVGGTMTPAFEATIGSQQSLTNQTYTKIVLATESFDTDSKYDASAGRFTPATAGKYFVYATVKITYGGGAGSGQYLAIYKNGSLHRAAGIDASTIDSHSVFAVVTLDSDDYVELYAYSQSNSANIPNESNRCVFGAYKIIE